MTIYLSGPITGHDDYLERFREAEMELASTGVKVVNPAWIIEPFAKTNATHKDFLSACLRLMRHCNAICMLKNWEQSKGALMELEEAAKLGMMAFKEKPEGGYTWVDGGAEALYRSVTNDINGDI